MTVPNHQSVLFFDCSPFIGGAQNSLVDMTAELRRNAVPVSVLSACPLLKSPCDEVGIPFRDFRARHWSRTLLGLVQYLHDRQRVPRALKLAINERKPRILHANTLRAALLVPGKICRAIPLVVHDRDLRAPAITRALVAQKARRILAISETVAAAWEEFTTAPQLQVLPNGLPVNRIAQTIPEDYEKKIDFILVADFVDWKRHALFLDAFALARQKQPTLQALVVGRSRDSRGRQLLHDFQRGVREKKLEGNLEILSATPNALPQIAAASSLVSCAQQEPFGRTIVEALSLGKTVIACDDGGGVVEVLRDCPAGKIVPATPEALAEALLHPPPPAAETARQRAQNYSSTKQVEKLQKIYQDL